MGKEIKEDILRALEGKQILLCPHCKNSTFLRKEFVRVEITEDSDGLLDNVIEGDVEEYEYRCVKCDEYTDVEDMIRTTKLVFNKD